MQHLNDNYFELFSLFIAVFTIACVILSFTITERQVQDKESSGEIKYSKTQLVILYSGVISFWALILLSTSILAYKMIILMDAYVKGM